MEQYSSRAKTARKRDCRVELARLIACFLVIGVHVLPPALIQGQYNYGRVFLSCLFADGVALFWMISGCFLFSRRYGKALQKGIVRILIPLLLASLAGLLINLLPLPGFVPSDMGAVLSDFFHWRNGVAGMEHLWYLYVNLLVIVLFPLFKWLAQWLDKDPLRPLVFLGITWLLFLVNDLFQNQLFHFSHYLLGGAIPAGIEMIWGHILYRWRSRFCGRKLALILLGVFLGINLVRSGIQFYQYGVSPENTAILYWFSASGLIAAASLLLMSFALFHPKRYRRSAVVQSADALVTAAASCSFVVYLVHYPIVRILTALGVTGQIQAFLTGGKPGLFADLLYIVLMSLLVFGLSWLMGELIQLFWKLVEKAVRKWHRNRAGQKQPE